MDMHSVSDSIFFVFSLGKISDWEQSGKNNEENPYTLTGNRFKDGLNKALRSKYGMVGSSILSGLASSVYLYG